MKNGVTIVEIRLGSPKTEASWRVEVSNSFRDSPMLATKVSIFDLDDPKAQECRNRAKPRTQRYSPSIRLIPMPPDSSLKDHVPGFESMTR